MTLNDKNKMITKSKSKWCAKYKLFFAIPIIVIGLLAFSNAEINLSDKIDNNREDNETQPEGMVFIPQGSFVMNRSDGKIIKNFTVSIDAFWMKEKEVSIKEYNEYLKSLKKNNTKDIYNTALPDFSKAPYRNYFTSKKYEDYPIVGVSLAQAKKFCIWKTNIENKKYKSKGKKPVHDYRIPLEAEWIYASLSGMNPENIVKLKVSPLTKTGSKEPNDWGLYNMFDNVSEFTLGFFNSGVGTGLSVTSIKGDTIRKSVQYFLNQMDSIRKQSEYINIMGDNYKDNSSDSLYYIEFNDKFDNVGFRYVRSYLGKKDQ